MPTLSESIEAIATEHGFSFEDLERFEAMSDSQLCAYVETCSEALNQNDVEISRPGMSAALAIAALTLYGRAPLPA